MQDSMIKILLAAIAVGLWSNIIVPLIRPTMAIAQYQSDYTLRSMDNHLLGIEVSINKLLATAVAHNQADYILNSLDNRLQSIEVGIDKLQTGSCSNGKLCL